jgi:protoheme IX farnesyltransferase
MTDTTSALSWKDYLELCKPRVVALIVFTAVVGMLLAVPGMPPLDNFFYGSIGIALAASSAAAINHFIDQKADAQMGRTKNRPLPTGHLNSHQVLVFASGIGFIAMAVLTIKINVLTAFLTFLSLIGYALIYTVYLKKMTPQNIVIGGAAGAAPPVLGWAAMANTVTAEALVLFLIIFLWTPPHFWALALYRVEDYRKSGLPMLPVTHGSEFTRLHIFLYTLILFAACLLPFMLRMNGWFYLVVAVGLSIGFSAYAWALWRDYSDQLARKTFRFSLIHLSLLFAAMLVDHYLMRLW